MGEGRGCATASGIFIRYMLSVAVMSEHGNSDKVTVLLGGAFNPPHLAHLLAAGAALSDPACADVWLIPCAAHPYEKDLLGFEQRVELCEAMIAPFAGRLSVSRIESELAEPNYTVRTLEALRGQHPGRAFAWLIASDNAMGIHQWKDAERLPELADIWVVGRTGEGGEIPAHMHQLAGLPLPPISSTLVRGRISAGESWRGLVAGSVAELIEQKHYYQ